MSDADSSDQQYALAIVGMAGRFPGADNLDQFWHNLCGGVESIATFSEQELLAAGVSPEQIRNPDYVPAKGALDNSDLFDAAFFGFNPREAEIMDPQQRLFLECAWTALEHAGYDPQRVAGTVGVYAGANMNTYLLFNLLTNADRLESVGVHQVRIANRMDSLATRVSYKLNLRGPSVTVQTACSTSLVAVHLACQSLLNRECDLALAGGVSVSVPERGGYLYQPGGIFSPDGHCRAFDAHAQGTLEGNGLGLVVLKRLVDALADGDTIHAVIKGSAINNDGAEKIGYTAPSVDGQAQVIAEAIAVAGVDPETISYIEAHGTATALGDPIEVAALTQAFRTRTRRTGFCALGSVKTNIGHLDAAAGIAGLLKTALALKHRALPPSLHFTAPNPSIDFAGSPFYVNTQHEAWSPACGVRRAGVSSLGIGGTNAHVILEEAPTAPLPTPGRSWQLLTLSARSATALDHATDNLLAHLKAHPNIHLADVAYTLQVGRQPFAQRRAVVCRDVPEAIALLEARLPDQVFSGTVGALEPSVIFLFPGQGAQYVGMAAEIYHTEPTFRRHVDRCAELLQPQLGLDLRTLLYPDAGAEAAATERLTQTEITQPALFVVEYALAQLWRSWGVEPQAMIGHSIGEYVAACLAGVFSLEDALKLVAARGRLMQSLPAGAMLTVSRAAAEVQLLLDDADDLAIAAHNGPNLCVVAGPIGGIERLQAQLSEQRIPCRRLHTSHAFHSPMMEPIVAAFADIVRQTQLHPPALPYLSNVTGTWISADEATDPLYWARQLRMPVRFVEAVQEVTRQEPAVLLEVGPGRALSTLVRQQTDQHLIRQSLRHATGQRSDMALLLETLGQLWLAGVPIDWTAVAKHEQRRRIPLPTYPFERQRYWIEAGTAGFGRLPHTTQTGAERVYLSNWQRVPPRQPASSPSPSRRLILAGKDHLSAGMIRQLAGDESELMLVHADAQFRQVDAQTYALNPDCDEDYHALAAALQDRDFDPTEIVFLWSLAEPSATNLDRQPPARRLWLSSLWRLAQALSSRAGSGPIRITIVGEGMQAVESRDATSPEQATLLAACSGLPQIAPHISCRAIDMIMPEPQSWHAARVIDQVVAEIRTGAADPVVAYRGPHRLVPTWTALESSADATDQLKLRHQGVYVLLDATSLTGLNLAAYLAQQLDARIAIIEAPTFPAQSEWDAWLAQPNHDLTSQKIQRLRAIEQSGAPLLLLRADHADPAQISAALQQVIERFEMLHGVITVNTAPLHGHDRCDLAAEQAAIQQHLDRLAALDLSLRDHHLDVCLMISPQAALLGHTDSLAATAVAAATAAFTHQQAQHSPLLWSSLHWDGAQHLTDDRVGSDRLAGILALPAVPQIMLSSVVPEFARRGQPTAPELAPVTSLADHARPELREDYSPPANAIEAGLAAIWADVLGLEQIGRYDNFFDLGGHSLLATQLLSRVRTAFQIELPLAAMFDTPTIATLAPLIEAAQAQAASSTITAPTPHERSAGALPPVQPVERTGPLPLSFSQQRLWFLDQLEPDTCIYTISQAVRLTGRLDYAVLDAALDQLVQRHETLRTAFLAVDGQPVQVVTPTLRNRLTIEDLQALPAAAREAEALRRATEEARRPFDLTQPPLWRTRLLVLDHEQHLLLLTLHHIIADGWSMGVLLSELAGTYSTLVATEGQAQIGAALPVQYGDFAQWQTQWLPWLIEQQLPYWRRQLAGAPPLLNLPTDRPRPPIQTYTGARRPVAFAPALTAALNQLSRQEGVTLFMTLLAAFKTLLLRYSGQHDIVVGSPIANRNRSEIEPLIGLFMNTLVLRTQLDGNPSFRELLGRVRQVALDAYAHQDLPLEQIVDDLQPERSLSYNPLFQVIFILQNAPMPTLSLPSLTLEPVEVDRGVAMFDLTLSLWEANGHLQGWIEYNTDLFDHVTIERLLQHYDTLLAGIVADAGQRLADLPLLSVAERQLLHAWSTTPVAGRENDPIHVLFARQAARTPEAVALIDGQQSLTYAELEARANQLAHLLRTRGVGPETRVALLVDRSPQLIVALLAILKAGGVYVPLDPSAPAERLRLTLRDANALLVLTQHERSQTLADAPVPLLDLDAALNEAAGAPITALAISVDPEQLAYVMYTSGSTGIPKGVAVPHRAVTRLVCFPNYLTIQPDDRFLQLAPVAFDASTLEIWGPLLNGAQLVIAPPHAVSLPEIGQLLRDYQITTLWLTAGLFHLLIDEQLADLVPIRNLLAGGDALSVPHVQRLLEAGGSVINGYGPTENTTFTCCYRVPSTEPLSSSVPIGRPIGQTEVYLLDARLEPVPIGVPGELYTGGAGLARGYLAQPALTAETFVPHPFSAQPGARLYRTGDLARFRADGTIEFLGRRDQQIKIRGFRIEIGEIELALQEHSAVREAVVIAREDAPNDKRLVAYLTQNDEYRDQELGAQVPDRLVPQLRGFLQAKLAEYMIPSSFVLLDALPLTPNGKIDRRALPTPTPDRESSDVEFVSPQGPIETLIASIYADLLQVSRVGSADNFFHLGGNSLVANRLVVRLREAFQVDLPLRAVFEAPTVAGLARYMADAQPTELEGSPQPDRQEPTALPLSPAQRWYWTLERWRPQNPALNVTLALRLVGRFQLAAFEASLNQIVARHEALRMSVGFVDRQPVQVIAPTLTLPLVVRELDSLAGDETAAQGLLEAEARQPFTLSEEPLVRVLILRQQPDKHLVLIVIHHIAVDAWSIGLMLHELRALYAAAVQPTTPGQPMPLPPPALQYSDYTRAQQRWLESEAYAAQLAYWQERLAGLPSISALPTDRPRPATLSGNGERYPFLIAGPLTVALNQLSEREGATLYMTLLTALNTWLFCVSGQDDLTVGSGIANRNQTALEQMVGLVANTIVLRSDLSGDPSFREALQRTREVVLGAYAHADIPFTNLIEVVQPEWTPAQPPLFQVMFVLQNTPQEPLELPELTIEPFEVPSRTTRYDLLVSLRETEQGIAGALEYSSDLFDSATILGFMREFLLIIEWIVNDPHQRLSLLRTALHAERRHTQLPQTI